MKRIIALALCLLLCFAAAAPGLAAWDAEGTVLSLPRTSQPDAAGGFSLSEDGGTLYYSYTTDAGVYNYATDLATGITFLSVEP